MVRVFTAGAAALALGLAGCGGRHLLSVPAPRTPPATAPAPAPAGGWVEALTFSGDVEGGLTQVLPDSAGALSECSGRNSRSAGAWASALYGQVGAGVYEVMVTVRPYRGPGTYRTPDVLVQVARTDGAAVWETSPGGSAMFTVGVGEESGTLSATLTNLSTTATELRLDGRWSCRT